MVIELFKLVGEEIAAEPVTFAIEVVQFLILVTIVWAVAWGFGKRRGFLRNMLSERQARVARDLEDADGAAQALEEAHAQATVAVKEARKAAKHDVAAAHKSADATLTEAKAATDREVEGMREHARELLELERQEMLEHARERLLDVVGRATRYILSEGLSPAEQRSLIQHSIMASLNGNGNGSGSPGAGSADPPRSREPKATARPQGAAKRTGGATAVTEA